MRDLAQQRRRSLPPRTASMLGLCGILPFAITLAGLEDYRVNLTASEPLGIWRILKLDHAPRPGELVFVCPPQTTLMERAWERGYLKSGLCPGHYAPLIKMVAALEGQQVRIDQFVFIDGKKLPGSALSSHDGRGRPLKPFSGGKIAKGFIYLHSSFPGSFDSRYFGPVPNMNVVGLAKQVLTYAP